MTKTPAVTAENTDWMTGFYNLVSALVQQGFSQDSATLHVVSFTQMSYAYARKFSQDYGEDYGSDFWHWYTNPMADSLSVRRQKKPIVLRCTQTITGVR
nr:hypothetical protein [Morganella morganii]